MLRLLCPACPVLFVNLDAPETALLPALSAWGALAAWDASVGEDGIARLRNPTGEPSARIFRLLPAR